MTERINRIIFSSLNCQAKTLRSQLDILESRIEFRVEFIGGVKKAELQKENLQRALALLWNKLVLLDLQLLHQSDVNLNSIALTKFNTCKNYNFSHVLYSSKVNPCSIFKKPGIVWTETQVGTGSHKEENN